MPISSDGNVGSLPFYKLPHPVNFKRFLQIIYLLQKGTGANVGSPFSKDYVGMYADKIFRATRFHDQLEAFLNSGSNTRFWGNYR